MRRWLGLLALTASLACHTAGEEEAAAALVPVETEPAAPATLTDQVEVLGHLRPIPGGSVLLSAPAAGVVRVIKAQVGAKVSAGSLVIDLDVPELGASARQLASAAELAAQEAARAERLYQEGIGARKEVERANSALASAKAALQSANQLAARSHVTSPITGQVQRIAVQVGERVDAGAPLVEIVDPSSLELVASVPGSVLRRLRPSQPAVVVTDSQSVTGTIRAIAPAVDSLTNTGEVRIGVPNRDRTLRPGAPATARITVGTVRDALTVPKTALVLVGGTQSVFVVSPDSVAHAKPVTVGVQSGDRVEIKGEIAKGDLVVTTGAYGLADGMKVVPAPAKARP
ncbi:MAG: efflux RND transporter periplasmic adaptor subunit [Gemmatimonadota bacterium]